MAIPDLRFTPPHILARLNGMKPYILLVLTKGANYDSPEGRRMIQSEHLPYLFEFRDKGSVLLSMPVMDESGILAIAIYNSTDKNEVKTIIDNDPAVKAGIFKYEMLTAMGIKGDALK